MFSQTRPRKLLNGASLKCRAPVEEVNRHLRNHCFKASGLQHQPQIIYQTCSCKFFERIQGARAQYPQICNSQEHSRDPLNSLVDGSRTPEIICYWHRFKKGARDQRHCRFHVAVGFVLLAESSDSYHRVLESRGQFRYNASLMFTMPHVKRVLNPSSAAAGFSVTPE